MKLPRPGRTCAFGETHALIRERRECPGRTHRAHAIACARSLLHDKRAWRTDRPGRARRCIHARAKGPAFAGDAAPVRDGGRLGKHALSCEAMGCVLAGGCGIAIVVPASCPARELRCATARAVFTRDTRLTVGGPAARAERCPGRARSFHRACGLIRSRRLRALRARRTYAIADGRAGNAYEGARHAIAPRLATACARGSAEVTARARRTARRAARIGSRATRDGRRALGPIVPSIHRSPILDPGVDTRQRRGAPCPACREHARKHERYGRTHIAPAWRGYAHHRIRTSRPRKASGAARDMNRKARDAAQSGPLDEDLLAER